jgi:hypothetical protein
MKTTNKLISTATAAIAVTLLFQTPLRLFGDDSQQGSDANGDDHSQRLSITFNKCQTSPGILQGTVDGDCGSGTIFFMALPGSIVGTSVVQFGGEYTVTACQCSFKAVCAGTRCISTGHIVLNGVVTEGPRMGDLVHVDAQLVFEQGVRCSQGTMTVTVSDPGQTPACK